MKNIKENYPKSWDMMKSYCEFHDVPSDISDRHVQCYFGNEHELFFFFDEMGLYIEIVVSFIEYYNYRIHNDIDYLSNEGLNFKTRKKAETAAIEKAFEILEKQLNHL